MTISKSVLVSIAFSLCVDEQARTERGSTWSASTRCRLLGMSYAQLCQDGYRDAALKVSESTHRILRPMLFYIY